MKIKVLFLSYCLLFLSCEDVFEKDISRKKVEVMAPGAGWVLNEAEQVLAGS